MKLAYVAHAPAPYHTPILNALAAEIELRVIYMSRGESIAPLSDPWGCPPNFAYEFHRSLPISSAASDFRTRLSLGVTLRLKRFSLDVVMFNSWSPIGWEPLL